MDRIRIAILASGSGTNAQNISEYFKNNKKIDVELFGSNKSNALVLNRAKNLGIKSFHFTKDDLERGMVVETLVKHKIQFVVLAGFLLKIPQNLLDQFPNKILNIHPALLPKFGGKGMYGNHVHKAVIDSKEKISGITIHVVNENYDEGNIIFQAMTEVNASDTADSLASRIHQLEYEYFPAIIEDYLLNTR